MFELSDLFGRKKIGAYKKLRQEWHYPLLATMF